MARVSPRAIEAIERDLTDHLVRHFDLDVRRVLSDATNFSTPIDSFNDRCTVARRGKSKGGRAALRIVGLALLVTAEVLTGDAAAGAAEAAHVIAGG